MAKAKAQEIEPNEAEELATTLGLNFKTVTVRGEEIRIEEFELEQLPELLTVLKGLMAGATTGITDQLLLQSGEIGIRLAMLATGRPRVWFKKLPLGDGLALYAAVIEANPSFFNQSEHFVSLIQLVGGLFAPAAVGPASSASSVEAASDSAKSEG